MAREHHPTVEEELGTPSPPAEAGGSERGNGSGWQGAQNSVPLLRGLQRSWARRGGIEVRNFSQFPAIYRTFLQLSRNPPQFPAIFPQLDSTPPDRNPPPLPVSAPASSATALGHGI